MLAKGMGHLLLTALLVGVLLLPGIAMAVMVGKPTPDFTLQSTGYRPRELPAGPLTFPIRGALGING